MLLIILVCLLPTVALSAFVLLDQRAERKSQLDAIVLRQAELLNGDITSIAEGARSLLTMTAEFDLVREPDQGCDQRLIAVQRGVPSYSFIALLDRKGAVVCASSPAVAAAANIGSGWVRDALEARRFGVGRFAVIPGLDSGVVPFFLPIGPDGNARTGVLVAGLSLDWLGSHLNDLHTT
ncbi:MAG: cache domain-containing protein, partial [Alphaproteobacteria bacterium]|nr:cache domain-containing protein [Alphaproteobacteria bacterium]